MSLSPRSAGLSYDRDLHHEPHPISANPRPNPNDGPGYEHERTVQNSHHFAARIPRFFAKMSLTNEEDDQDNIRMKCCCGRSDCAYLEHNDVALGGLERDLETAARLGQALLLRHESYINQSQAEQTRLSASISDLEAERLSLQNANEKIVAENRELLQQLEHLNIDLSDSDRDVKRLESLLFDCELEVKRLNGLVRRTEELDHRVQEMERERQALSKQMEEGREETRSTLARWRESERRVRELEENVQRIEWEARLDREKHDEIVARFTNERSSDRESSVTDERSRGSSALPGMDGSLPGSKNVVSHFVRDILKDNANLQAGIAELRHLLQSSNEEVQKLREQVMLHQPVLEEEEDEEENQPRRSISLDQELEPETTLPKPLQQEVHVHHHYHTKLGKNRSATSRKPSRRRALVTGLGVAPEPSTTSTTISRAPRYVKSPVVPVNLYQPQPQKNRWSMQSSATMSSVLSSIPSSPRSYFDRNGSIFDRLEQGEESSRPTSPESVGDLLSPGPGQWKFKTVTANFDTCEEEQDRKETFDMSPLVESKPVFDANELPTPFIPEELSADKQVTPKPSVMLQPQTVGARDSTSTESRQSPPNDAQVSTNRPQETFHAPHQVPLDLSPIRPSRGRRGSHETLVSISGMDIHIAQRASPAATLELLHSHFAHSPAQARKVSAAQPLASVTEYTAVPSIAPFNHDVNRSQREIPSSIEALSGIAVPRPRAPRATSQTGAIGRLGGWVMGKWGAPSAKSNVASRSTSFDQSTGSEPSTAPQTDTDQENIVVDTPPRSVKALNQNTVSDSTPNSLPTGQAQMTTDLAMLFAGRSPGVNQPGFIPGFRAALMSRRTPSQVMASVIDGEGLKEGLAE